MSQRIENLVKGEKKLNPNVDFYSASTYYTLGIPIDLFTPIFAVSRVSGWTAHCLEQYANNRLDPPAHRLHRPAVSANAAAARSALTRSGFSRKYRAFGLGMRRPELRVHFPVAPNHLCSYSRPMMMLPTPTEMYRALVERDQSFEGLFFACVRTTGIFCRPTCRAASRSQKTSSSRQRSRKRCIAAIARAASAIRCQRRRQLPTGLRRSSTRCYDGPRFGCGTTICGSGPGSRPGPAQFQALLRNDFQAYQRACRLGTAMRALHDGAPTLDAGLEAGFESDSGFREAFARVFGETPGDARDTRLLTAAWMETPLGPMLAIAAIVGWSYWSSSIAAHSRPSFVKCGERSAARSFRAIIRSCARRGRSWRSTSSAGAASSRCPSISGALIFS
jgi:methylphosphotriester-DNA--protein-cysteine methyltransferase